MSFNLTGLSNYTDETSATLVKKMIAQAKTAQFCTIQPNIKSSMKIPLVNSVLSVAAQACGWVATGSTVLGQRTIVVDPKQITEALCLADAETKYLQYQIAAGAAGLQDVNFAQQFVDEKIEQLKLYNDVYFWSTFKTTLQGNSATTVNVGSTTAWTVSNAVNIIDTMKTSVPAGIRSSGDLVMFVAEETFDTILIALKNANYFHIDPTQDLNYVMNYLGIKIVGVAGLNTSGTAVLTSKKNIIWGCDLMSDEETIDLWYSKDNREIRLAANWKAPQGNVLFYDLCVVKLS